MDGYFLTAVKQDGKNNVEQGQLEVNLAKNVANIVGLKDKRYKANFDARAFNMPTYEVVNNLIWRQQDCTRNSVNLLAQSLYPHKELQGINSKDLQDKMFTEKGINWNEQRTDFKRGACAIKDENGKWFIDTEIPIFTEDREYIRKLVDLD